MSRREIAPVGRGRLSAEQLEQNVELARKERTTARQAEALLQAQDDASAAEQREVEGLSRQQLRDRQLRQAKLEERRLRLLERDDEAIRRALQRRELDAVLDGSQAGELDELLWFVVSELKLSEALEKLAPPPRYVEQKTGKEIERRTMYGPLLLNLLGIMSRSLGLASGPEVQAELLTDERWMALMGFSAEQVLEGCSRRGESLKGKTRDGQGGRFEEAGEMGPARAVLEGPRGALSSQAMAGHESLLEPQELVAFFNAVVRAMARRGLFPKEVHASLDSTGEEVVPSFQGAGLVRKKAKVASKARRPRQVEVTVRGFKVWYLMDVATGLPVGFAFDRIEKPEVAHAKAVIDQARANLQGHGRLVSVALDRGFLDGDLLWWLKQERGIEWYCPAKEKMEVTAEARQRVNEVLCAGARAGETAVETAQRLARGNQQGQAVVFYERHVAEGRESLVVAQVEGLEQTDFYGPGGSSSSRVHSKKYRPTALAATVVLRWPDRSRTDQQDAEEHDEPSKGPVVLLSPSAEGGLVRYDRYDERSLIENRLNREGKQHFGLGSSLARNEKALMSATVFATVALMLHRGLELHEAQAVEQSDRRAEPLGVLRYRRQRMLKYRGTIIVIVGDRYGRIPLREFAMMAGFHRSQPQPEAHPATT